MEEFIKIFNDFAKLFDISNEPLLMMKYHHSQRVMDLCKDIARSINLSEREVLLASVCGLFHDVGRFPQYTKYKTYEDSKSIDHGDVGESILRNLLINNFNLTDKEKEVVLFSTKEHNKKIISECDDLTRTMTNIVRDADKLDIMKLQCNKIYDETIVLKDILLNSIYNGTTVNNADVLNDTDGVLRCLSWVNDFNYDFSYKYLLDEEIVGNKFKLLEMYGITDEEKKLKEYVYSKLNGGK